MQVGQQVGGVLLAGGRYGLAAGVDKLHDQKARLGMQHAGHGQA